MSASKPPLVCGAASGAWSVAGTPGPLPRETRADAVVTSGGAPRRSFGYARSSLLRLSADAVVSTTSAPSDAWTTTSFQPMRDAKLPSRNSSLEPDAGRLVDGVEAQRLQPAGSRPLDGPTLEHAQRRAAAVDAEVEVPCRLGGERRPADRVAELERRDLGHVERVVDVDAAARELDRRVPVDREVAERMRLRRRRDEQRRQAGDDEQEPLHARASRATGAQRMEKCGFRSSARRNHVFAAPSWPRQRSIMARWK